MWRLPARAIIRWAGWTACCLIALAGQAAEYVALPGGTFRSVVPADGVRANAVVAPFRLRARPVTHADYLAFVRAHPAWQRGRAPALLAGRDYLARWAGPLDLGQLDPAAPVTQLSWFAARAFCASEGARLPRWYEWEYAAAADETRRDARDDAAWRSRILSWYARPAAVSGADVATQANVYGVYDLHQRIWEWVEDFNALLVNVDSRAQGEQKLLDYCGAAALTLGDRENYAILMRVALLSALNGNDTGGDLGFRCAQDATAMKE